MATPSLEHDRVDRLDVGTGKIRRGHRRWRWRPWWPAAAMVVAVVLVAGAGVAVGWVVHDPTGAEVPQAGPPNLGLLVGTLEQNLNDPFGPDFLLWVKNTGPEPIALLNVSPEGMSATSPHGVIHPGQAFLLPIDVSLNCAFSMAPDDTVVARVATGSTRRTLRLKMPDSPPALLEMYNRRCAVESLAAPSKHELLGSWLVVDGGPGFTGRMFAHFAADGRYEMDAGIHLSDDPAVVGRYSLAGRRLTLKPVTGGRCGGGQRAVWEVGLRNDGRLHIRQLTSFDGYCRVERGDVWIAQRIIR